LEKKCFKFTLFWNFVSSQIDKLVARKRSENPNLSREEEIEAAIDFCNSSLVASEDSSSTAPGEEAGGGDGDEQKRREVLAKSVIKKCFF
jgi:hypothetical protein